MAQASATITTADSSSSSDKISLKFLHFNDVYNIQAIAAQSPTDLVGGAARFVHLVKSKCEGAAAAATSSSSPSSSVPQPIVFFSGDAISPSTLSAAHLGRHIIPILNNVKVVASPISNHDLDFGADVFEACRQASNFPWLCSNAWERGTDRKQVWCNCERYTVITDSASGLRIGLLGLIEREWLSVMYVLSEDTVEYVDFVEAAKELSAHLREIEKVDLVVALTHMRVPNDNRLADEAGGAVDLVLGGHDHFVYQKQSEKTGMHVIKSGCDFKNLSEIEITVSRGSGAAQRSRITELKCVVHNLTQDMPEDAETAKLVRDLDPFKHAKTIGHTTRALDCTTEAVRTRETAIANFTADTVLHHFSPTVKHSPSIVIFNAGTIRADCVIPKGPITDADFARLYPMVDDLTVLECTGAQVLGALNNGVCCLPKQEGCFPCVSGVKFAYRIPVNEKPAERMSRVVPESVVCQDRVTGEWKPLDLQKIYYVCTKQYCAEGRDNYTIFQECKVAISHEELEGALNCAVRNYFLQLGVVAALKQATGKRDAVKQAAVKHAALKLRRMCLHRQDSSSSDSDGDGSRKKLDNQSPCDLVQTKREAKLSQIFDPEKQAAAEAAAAEDVQRFAIQLLPQGAAISPFVEGRIRRVE